MAAHSEPDFINPFRRNNSDSETRRAAPPRAPPAPLAPLEYEPSAWHYDMSGDKILHIFNHYRYQKTRFFRKQPTVRHGTARDAARLTAVFTALGFRCLLHQDKTHEEIHEIVLKLSQKEHAGTSCVCVAVLTHGEERGVVLAADRPYELRELVARLQHGDKGLVGKPKLFLVQACRGDELDPGRVQLDGAGGATIGTHADTLVLTSSVEDFVSWRDAEGSWLMQELCRVLESTHRELDFLQMTTLVTSLVARERASNTPSSRAQHRMKQTPETRSTLTKLLRFSRADPTAADAANAAAAVAAVPAVAAVAAVAAPSPAPPH